MIIDSPIISGSYAASGSLNQFGDVIITGSLTVTGNITGTASVATSASYAANASAATSASYAATASYISGSGGGVGFPFSGSAVITGSLLITELSGSGTKYVITDNNGLLSISSGSTAIKVTEAITSTTNQTSFVVPNGYTTGLVDVFINGIKLSDAEFTDNDGVTITLATGSNNGDIVEFAKYQPANGVTNNALRQQTTFTATAGQTVFSASYTPGLIDIFYNGSKLTSSDFIANNGTYFTLATASAADDILDVFVYSYQVGAFSGIAGAGVPNQVAYFGLTNDILGSNNLTFDGSTLLLTGSLTISGSSTFTNIGPAVFSGSITALQGISGVAATASSADNFLVRNTLTAQTLVVQTITSSVDFVTGSTRFGSIIGNTHVFTGSLNATGSSHSIIGDVGIGVSSPSDNFHLQNNEGYLSLLYKAVDTGNDTQISSNYHVYDYLGNRHGYETSISTYGYLNTFYQPGANYFGRSGSSTYFMHFESGYNTASLQKTIFQLNGNTKLTLLESGEIVMGKEDYSALYQTSWFPATLRGPQPSRFSSNIAGGSLIIQGGRGRGTGVGGDILFKTSNAGNESSSTLNAAQTRMVIKGPSGNVGIEDDNPSQKLSVGGSGQFSGGVFVGSGYRLEFVDQGTTSYSWIEGSSYNRAYSFLAFATSGSEKMRITSGGNVGIGTTNPTAILDIKGTGTYDFIKISNGSTSGGGGFLSYQNATASSWFGNSGGWEGGTSNDTGIGSYAGGIRFYTNGGTEKMRITSVGNVGIGINTPNSNHKLEVNGALAVNGINLGNMPSLGSIGSGGVLYLPITTGAIAFRSTNGATGYGSITADTGNIIFSVPIKAPGESQFYYGPYSDPGPGTAYDAKFGGTSGGGIAVRGNSVFVGSVSKGGGSFRIDHPLPEKKDTHFLLHSFIEGPTPDLIYRGVVTLVNGTAVINIDEVSDMTEGTFVLLNKRVQCFTTNESGWDLTKGKVKGNILTITSQNSESTDEISWMVVGERNDEWMQNSDMTDENGKIIVEKEKPTITEEII